MMDAKHYLLAYLAMTISNYCDGADDDKYLTKILDKLAEMDKKISAMENKVDKISTLEHKVDRLLNEMQGCDRSNYTGGKLLL